MCVGVSRRVGAIAAVLGARGPLRWGCRHTRGGRFVRVVSYLVSQRRREIGTHVALGAPRHGIIALVVRQGMLPALGGLVLGAGAALAAGIYLGSVLYRVRAHDPLVFGHATALTVVALAAVAVLAVRASGIDPVTTLRGDQGQDRSGILSTSGRADHDWGVDPVGEKVPVEIGERAWQSVG